MATILGCANRVRTHDGTVGAMVSPAFSRPSPALFANGRSVTRSPIGWTSRCSNQPTPVSLSRSQHGTVGLGTRAASGADGSSVETTTDTKKTTADTTDTPPPGATNVRVRVLRGELEIPRICSLCAAVFKEVAVPMPEGTEDPLLLRIGDFLESRYETAMVKDLSSVITKNMREKQRSKNQWHQEFGRIKARATARELQALQRTRTSVDSLTIEQLTEMRIRISDEIEIALEENARDLSPEEKKRQRTRQWIQLQADGTVAGGVATGLVSVSDGKKKFLKISDATKKETGDDARPCEPRELIASATLQVCVPDAAFPPPFPTNKPYRSYLANMAVAPEARRSGVASKVIQYAERLTKLWGFTEMWLHVNIDNGGAFALYKKLGYEIVSTDPLWYLDRRYLMVKKLKGGE